jgi:hypothetical protein
MSKGFSYLSMNLKTLIYKKYSHEKSSFIIAAPRIFYLH